MQTLSKLKLMDVTPKFHTVAMILIANLEIICNTKCLDTLMNYSRKKFHVSKSID
jgi:hypothetical protein